MDEALKNFRETIDDRRQQDQTIASALADVRQQYVDWLYDTAVPTFKKLEAELNDIESGSEIVPRLVEPYGQPPRAGIDVTRPGRPTFVYRLFLHPKPVTERAFVMKERTAKNYDWRPGDRASEKTQVESAMFFNERNDGRHNHAPEITAEDIVKDFQRDYLAHRDAWF